LKDSLKVKQNRLASKAKQDTTLDRIKLKYLPIFLSTVQHTTNKMNTIRLTQENAHKYLGHDIIFRAHNKDTLKMNHVIKKIRCVRGCTIEIDCPSLNNRLGIKTFEIYVILS
jgi:hypothetical protein